MKLHRHLLKLLSGSLAPLSDLLGFLDYLVLARLELIELSPLPSFLQNFLQLVTLLIPLVSKLLLLRHEALAFLLQLHLGFPGARQPFVVFVLSSETKNM